MEFQICLYSVKGGRYGLIVVTDAAPQPGCCRRAAARRPAEHHRQGRYEMDALQPVVPGTKYPALLCEGGINNLCVIVG